MRSHGALTYPERPTDSLPRGRHSLRLQDRSGPRRYWIARRAGSGATQNARSANWVTGFTGGRAIFVVDDDDKTLATTPKLRIGVSGTWFDPPGGRKDHWAYDLNSSAVHAPYDLAFFHYGAPTWRIGQAITKWF